MFREGGEPRSFSLAKDVTVVGRREDADFRIPLTDISRKHCRLIKTGNSLKVEDLGSSNGTYVNGQKIQMSKLGPGDTLQVGPVPFVVQIDGVPGDQDIRPGVAPVGSPAAAAAARHGGTAEFDPMEALNEDPDASGGFDIIESAEHETVDDDIIIDMDPEE